MTERPSLEETIRDIGITKSEIEAYVKLSEGYKTLSELPEINLSQRRIHDMRASLYRDKALEAKAILDQLEKYKEILEGETT